MLPKEVDVHALLAKRYLPDLADARKRLIQHLSRDSRISRRVLDAMAVAPRHAFAPPSLWHLAYADMELWTPGHFLAKPSIIARVASLVVESQHQKVLEYAAWGGYTSCILACVCKAVYTVEHDPWMLWLAADAYRLLKLDNIAQKASDGIIGWPERAPYDAILFGAALPSIPEVLLSQVKDGGNIIAPVGPFQGPQRITKATRQGNTWKLEDIGTGLFPPLSGAWARPLAAPGAPFPVPSLEGAVASEQFAVGAYERDLEHWVALEGLLRPATLEGDVDVGKRPGGLSHGKKVKKVRREKASKPSRPAPKSE